MIETTRAAYQKETNSKDLLYKEKAHSSTCMGHKEQEDRTNILKIIKRFNPVCLSFFII